MKQSLETAFSRILENNCLQTTDSEYFEITDVQGFKCLMSINHSENGHLKVSNHSLKEVSFLAIDGCLFFSNDRIQRCDFAVFDNLNFYFIEIKSISGSKRIKRNDAIEQLKSTIHYFRNQGIIFDNYELTAVICFSATYPRIKAIDLDKKLQFEKDCHADLIESNEIKF
jgi:hypothetical protein